MGAPQLEIVDKIKNKTIYGNEIKSKMQFVQVESTEEAGDNIVFSVDFNDVLKNKRSEMWTNFTPVDESYAQCDLCNQIFSYKTSISNLKKHLQSKHPTVSCNTSKSSGNRSRSRSSLPTPKVRRIIEASTSAAVLDDPLKIQGDADTDGSETQTTERSRKNKNKKRVFKRQTDTALLKHFTKENKRSTVWTNFMPVDETYAQCNLCLQNISYKSSITNLKKHLVNKHSTVSCNTRKSSGNRDRWRSSLQTSQVRRIDEASTSAEVLDDLNQIQADADSEGSETQTTQEHSRKNKNVKQEIISETFGTENEKSDFKKEQIDTALLKLFTKENKRSEVWTNFTPVNETYAQCDLCKQNISYKTTISNLKKHLQSKHSRVSCNTRKWSGNRDRSRSSLQTPQARHIDEASTSAEVLDDLNQIQADADTEGSETQTTQKHSRKRKYVRQKTRRKILVTKNKRSVFNKKQIDTTLLKLFTRDFQPLRIVEDEGFKEFVRALNPSYSLPDRRTISNSYIPAAYEKCLEDTRLLVSKATNVCLSTYCWSSSKNDALLAVTCHFIIEENFELKSVLLECLVMNQNHTSENLSIEINRIITEWGLVNKVTLVVSDNANDIKHAIEDLLHLKHVGCFAHSLNLVVQNPLKKGRISEILDEVRGIVAHFKRSVVTTEKLMSYQKNNNMTPKKIMQDVSTRWNSTFLMLDRFIELKDALSSTLALIDKTSLTIEEWNICEQLCDVLKPFENATKIVSGEKYVTASVIIPLVNGLSHICRQLSVRQNYTPEVKELVVALQRGVEERFGNIEMNKTLGICTFLDPRFKDVAFQSEDCAANIKNQITSDLADIFQSTENNSRPPNILNNETPTLLDEEEKLSIWNAFEAKASKFKPAGTPASRGIVELQRYMEEDLLARTEDPLVWWRDNKHNYPNLRKIVQAQFCCVGTSVPCEGLYSKTGMLLSEDRTQLTLSPEKLSQLIFLNSNS